MAAALELLRRRCPEPPATRAERDRALGILVRRGYAPDLAFDALRRHAGAGRAGRLRRQSGRSARCAVDDAALIELVEHLRAELRGGAVAARARDGGGRRRRGRAAARALARTPTARLAAARLMHLLPDEGHVAALEPLLADPDPDVAGARVARAAQPAPHSRVARRAEAHRRRGAGGAAPGGRATGSPRPKRSSPQACPARALAPTSRTVHRIARMSRARPRRRSRPPSRSAVAARARGAPAQLPTLSRAGPARAPAQHRQRGGRPAALAPGHDDHGGRGAGPALTGSPDGREDEVSTIQRELTAPAALQPDRRRRPRPAHGGQPERGVRRRRRGARMTATEVTEALRAADRPGAAEAARCATRSCSATACSTSPSASGFLEGETGPTDERRGRPASPPRSSSAATPRTPTARPSCSRRPRGARWRAPSTGRFYVKENAFTYAPPAGTIALDPLDRPPDLQRGRPAAAARRPRPSARR